MKRKKWLAVFLTILTVFSLSACGADSSPAAGDTQPTDNSQAWGPHVVALQEEIDISTFEKAMALWNTYADQAQPQPDGPLVLEFGFPSQNKAHMWRFDADNRFDVRLEKPSGDYWDIYYWLDGTIMGRILKETNPDGTYVELDEMLNNPEGNHMNRCTYAADGTIRNKVTFWNGSWSVCCYDQNPAKLTTEEQVKEFVKAVYSEVDISQQEYYDLSIVTGAEGESVNPNLWATHKGNETSILYTADEENYCMSSWISGERMGFSEQRTIGGYYYSYADKDIEYTIEGREGVAKYSSGKQITFKVLPDETYGAKAYPLTEQRDGMDITYCYTGDDSSYCNRVYVTDHKTGDYLVFTLDSVRDPGYLDYFISVDWTHNGVTTHYDEGKNRLGKLVYKIPWFPSDEIGVSWVSPPLRAVSGEKDSK